MTLPAIGLRYMTRFQCIGAECEDDCCTGWAIPVDEAHYRALGERLSSADFSLAIQPLDAPTPRKHALMVLKSDSRCAMLGDDKLCAIQSRLGEPLLPDVCAVFPRSAGISNGRVELAGSLSCPEAARLCLSEENATDVVPIDPSLVARGLLYRKANSEDAYAACLDGVRAAFQRLLADRQFPLPSRLFFLAWFAHQTETVFRRDAPFDPREVAATLQRLTQAPVRAELHRQFASATVDDPFPMSVITEVLAGNRAGARPAFLRVVDTGLASYGSDAHQLDRLWIAHKTRAAAVGERLDRYLENFARNFVFKDWFLRSPSFVDWAFGLFVRVALVRFLLVAHPALEESAERAAVEVVYTLTRTLEHEEAPMARVLEALRAQGMRTLSHAVTLLKV